VKRLVVLLGLLLLLAVPAGAAAKPQGLIRELPFRTNVVDISPGPGGDLWFTENLGVNAIGRVSPGGRMKRFKLPPGVDPSFIVEGPDGNLWFSFEGGNFGYATGGVGRMTPAGKFSLFPEPEAAEGSPWEIIVGSDGNLWFDHAAIFSLGQSAIGRVTMSGEITEFGAGINAGAQITNLVLGADGNVWFGDESDKPAVGRVTPSGQITEFPGIKPEEYPLWEGPTATAAGPLYFSSNTRGAIAAESITPSGEISHVAGLSRKAEHVGPFAVGADGNVWFRDERGGVAGPDGPAIVRLNGSGQLTEFDKCLRALPEFAGPDELTLGPDGNVWFSTREAREYARDDRGKIAGVGYVSPQGKITELRYGLPPESEVESLTAAGGRLWFIDRRADAIGEVAPPKGPPNTFLVVGVVRRHGASVLQVRVPGPGKLRLEELGPGGRSAGAAASACGASVLPIPLDRTHREFRQRDGHLDLKLAVTFTPRGGSPFTEHFPVVLEGKR
jgi:streptogramin lyase